MLSHIQPKVFMSRTKVTGVGHNETAKSPSETGCMTDVEIQEARKRLQQLAKQTPPDNERLNRGRGIVEKLFEQIGKLRAAGHSWPRIQQEIGVKVADWKPKTLERYFQMVKKSHGTARGLKGKPEASVRKPKAARSGGDTGGSASAKTDVPTGESGGKREDRRPKYDPNEIV